MRTDRLPISLGVFCLVVAFPLTGCDRASATSRPAPSAKAAELAKPTPPPLPSVIASVAAVERGDLGRIFREEAANRPAAAIPAETVFAAFDKSGVAVKEARQHLARPFGAHYCSGAKVERDIALSVCEYTDAASASTGRTGSERGLASIPNRQVLRNGATTLTIRLSQKDAPSEALAQRLAATFAKLKK